MDVGCTPRLESWRCSQNVIGFEISMAERNSRTRRAGRKPVLDGNVECGEGLQLTSVWRVTPYASTSVYPERPQLRWRSTVRRSADHRAHNTQPFTLSPAMRRRYVYNKYSARPPSPRKSSDTSYSTPRPMPTPARCHLRPVRSWRVVHSRSTGVAGR